jgi:hypothetical protein
MIWRRQVEEEEKEEGGVVSPLFFSSLLQATPFASPTTVIANFSNYYKLCKNSGQNCYQYGSSLLYPIQCFFRTF